MLVGECMEVGVGGVVEFSVRLGVLGELELEGVRVGGELIEWGKVWGDVGS